ncbi:MAG: 16S rRNA (guanine(527)-N(7))-methyltransferase RsmG, partial [Bacteroidales bacterium]|nr:16S rRNA (guanine(527)-N(7))-methyltransferase RsmG [Bacteroidales bacterium]
MDSLDACFPQLTAGQKTRFEALLPLYETWNARINVLSRKETPEQWRLRHVLHSLSIARFITFKPGSTVMDLGTGGGFPGIPLAIMFPETSFYLVDSIGKKIKVVQAVVEALELTNVRAEQVRAEAVTEPFHLYLSPAWRPSTELPAWIK